MHILASCVRCVYAKAKGLGMLVARKQPGYLHARSPCGPGTRAAEYTKPFFLPWPVVAGSTRQSGIHARRILLSTNSSRRNLAAAPAGRHRPLSSLYHPSMPARQQARHARAWRLRRRPPARAPAPVVLAFRLPKGAEREQRCASIGLYHRSPCSSVAPPLPAKRCVRRRAIP